MLQNYNHQKMSNWFLILCSIFSWRVWSQVIKQIIDVHSRNSCGCFWATLHQMWDTCMRYDLRKIYTFGYKCLLITHTLNPTCLKTSNIFFIPLLFWYLVCTKNAIWHTKSTNMHLPHICNFSSSNKSDSSGNSCNTDQQFLPMFLEIAIFCIYDEEFLPDLPQPHKKSGPTSVEKSLAGTNLNPKHMSTEHRQCSCRKDQTKPSLLYLVRLHHCICWQPLLSVYQMTEK